MSLLFSHSHAFCSNTLQILNILCSVPQLVQFRSVCVHGKTNSLHVLGILNDFVGNNSCPIIITTNLQHLCISYMYINYPIIFALFFFFTFNLVYYQCMDHIYESFTSIHVSLYVLLFFHQFVYLCISTITPSDLFDHQSILCWHVRVLTVDSCTLWSLHDSH